MIEKILWISDFHIPYHNKKATEKFFDFLEMESDEITTLVLGGDILDFISPSRFEKTPDQMGTLQQELNTYYKFMDRLKEIYKGDIIYIIGNHETRIDKYLKRNHELYGLDVLKLSSLLKVNEYGVKLCYEWKHNNFLFVHGKYCNKYHANKELEMAGMSGISGHVHRHVVHSKTDRSGKKIWISAPCMQDFRKQDFVHNPDWQTGWVVLGFENGKFYGYSVSLR